MRIVTVIVLLLLGSSIQASGHKRIPGDLNGDGYVNFADFMILAENFGRGGGAVFDPSAGPEIIVTTEVIRDTIISPQSRLHPRIFVEEIASDPWGKPAEFIEHLCMSTYRIFTEHIVETFDSDILVSPNGNIPWSELNSIRDSEGRYRIFLIKNTESKAHLVLISTFAHEYVHLLGKHSKTPSVTKQLWLQESMAITAELFVMNLLKERLSDPQYWKDWEYVDSSGQLHAPGPHMAELITQYSRWNYYRYPENAFLTWFHENLTEMEAPEYAAPAFYRLYGIVAQNLVDIFLTNPEAWNILQYMLPYSSVNYTSIASLRLEFYLAGWWLRTPDRWQKYVAEISRRFGVDVRDWTQHPDVRGFSAVTQPERDP